MFCCFCSVSRFIRQSANNTLWDLIGYLSSDGGIECSRMSANSISPRWRSIEGISRRVSIKLTGSGSKHSRTFRTKHFEVHSTSFLSDIVNSRQQQIKNEFASFNHNQICRLKLNNTFECFHARSFSFKCNKNLN